MFRAAHSGGRAARSLRLAFALFLLSASCGADEPALGQPPDGPRPAGDVVVIEYKYRFEPAQLAVPSGVDLTVVVENRDDKTSHNIHFPTVDGSPRTKLENGRGYQTLAIRFDKPGRYPFVCDIHATMRGIAVATPAGS